MPLNWERLVWMTDDELSRLDIAAVNLACAEGLPGAPTEGQTAECLDRLDHYARSVDDYTRRCLPDFHARPDYYHRSPGKFRMISLLRCLQKFFRVLYNEGKIPLDVPLDTADTFIHGALLGGGGTCASLPVVYAAVGRRLGYPLKLVTITNKTAGHMFVRWDEPGVERFNFEACLTGCDTPTDDHYRGLHDGMPPEIERMGGHLTSLTPRRELSNFLVQRACRLREAGNLRQAAQSFAWALSAAPEDLLLDNTLRGAMNAWGDALRAWEPAGFPAMHFPSWPPRRFPPTLPLHFERNIQILEAWENLLKEPELESRYWGPMRRGLPGPRPYRAIIEHGEGGHCGIRLSFDPVATALATAWGPRPMIPRRAPPT